MAWLFFMLFHCIHQRRMALSSKWTSCSREKRTLRMAGCCRAHGLRKPWENSQRVVLAVCEKVEVKEEDRKSHLPLPSTQCTHLNSLGAAGAGKTIKAVGG